MSSYTARMCRFRNYSTWTCPNVGWDVTSLHWSVFGLQIFPSWPCRREMEQWILQPLKSDDRLKVIDVKVTGHSSCIMRERERWWIRRVTVCSQAQIFSLLTELHVSAKQKPSLGCKLYYKGRWWRYSIRVFLFQDHSLNFNKMSYLKEFDSCVHSIRCRLDHQGTGMRFSEGVKLSVFSPQTHIQWLLSRRLKRTNRETGHSFPPRVQIQHLWNSTPLPQVLIALCLIKHRSNYMLCC